MVTYKELPTQELIQEWLDYDKETGVFTWIKEPLVIGSCCWTTAGTKRKTGYIYICFRHMGLFCAHRLAWVYMFGSLSKSVEIDHKDGDPSNNRIVNLRLATSSQQKQNKGVQSNNRSGLKGAYFHACHAGKKWRSQIKVGSRLIFLGYFCTAEEAHAVYLAAAQKYYGEFFSHHGVRRHQAHLDAEGLTFPLHSTGKPVE